MTIRGGGRLRGKVCDYKKGAGNLGGWEDYKRGTKFAMGQLQY